MTNNEQLMNSIIMIATESYRLKRNYYKILTKLEPSEQSKYFSQFEWFGKRVEEALEIAGLKIQEIEGHKYDPGMAVTPLNIDDFDVDTELYILQTIEPIIMNKETGRLVKSGLVMLGEKDE